MKCFPKVSVLIPAYNYAHFLDEAIQSVLNQSYTDFELIIVDNQSTDNTEQVIHKYLDDKRVFYHKNSTNLGAVGNFNKCLEYAKGEYIKFLMADDRLHPLLLEKFVVVMDQYINVSLVTSNWEMFDLKTKKIDLPLKYLQEGKKVIYEILNSGKGNWIGAPTSVMFRRSNLRIGNFKKEFSCLVDLNMWLRQLTVGDCYIIPEVLSYFRVHENQASNIKDLQNRLDEYYFYKIINTYNEYKLDFSVVDLDTTIKTKAIKCAKAMYKVIYKLHKKESRLIFTKAFKIAYDEGVIVRAFFSRVSKSLQ